MTFAFYFSMLNRNAILFVLPVCMCTCVMKLQTALKLIHV